MTTWARLTWQAADPAALAADLERRLCVPGRDGGLVAGARLLDLGTAPLEVRPWVREGPADNPRRPGRLVMEPVPGGEPEGTPGAGGEPGGTPPPGASPLVLVGVGWTTVELDRAETELDMWLAPGSALPSCEDPHLGARARLRATAGLPGEWIVLLEPSTEGRAAASLARDDEGPCALYLWPPAGLDAWLGDAARRGVALRAGGRAVGPFGEQALLAGSPPAGPHIIVVAGRSPATVAVAAGTIAP